MEVKLSSDIKQGDYVKLTMTSYNSAEWVKVSPDDVLGNSFFQFSLFGDLISTQALMSFDLCFFSHGELSLD